MDEGDVREFLDSDYRRIVMGVALVAESMGHHPEWSNVWSRVTVDLTTHDAGGVSALDFDLAARMEGFAGKRP